MIVGIGHNSVDETLQDFSLQNFFFRINKLEDDKKDLAEDIRGVYAEAKDKGIDVKALRAVVKRQRADAEKLAAHEAAIDALMVKLGMV